MKGDYMYVASATSKGCGLNSPKPAPLLFHHIVSIQYVSCVSQPSLLYIGKR